MKNNEIYEAQKKYEEDMASELVRVEMELEEKGIHVVDHTDYNFCKRYVKVENRSFCNIYNTIFAIPETIDLKKIVMWFVNETKYDSVVVIEEKRNPTTICSQRDADWYFDI